GLCYVSQEGHSVGRSQIVSVDGTNADFSVGHSFDGPEVTVSKLNFSPIWRDYFGGPNHARLDVGHYDGAADDVPNSPIMKACKGLVGSFDVLAVEYSEPADALPSQTDILRLDVDFHYSCANSDAELHGKLRFTKPE
ncbi:MAG TPA: hypothetical protein VHP33_30490, partial [Polyangiaceae bacterium]|nr:hypothetical protein [Polyangiaceae bacterium]